MDAPQCAALLRGYGVLAACLLPLVATGQPVAARPVGVDDSIVMSRLTLEEAKFSADGRLFVVALKKGNLDNNTNEFSVLLFETAAALRSPQPQRLLTFASSSNRDAIRNLRWLGDSRTLAFIGEQPGGTPQIYRVDSRTREVRRLTDHPTAVVAYDISADGRRWAFTADAAYRDPTQTPEAHRQGIVVEPGRGSLMRLLTAGRLGRNQPQLFVQQSGEASVPFPLQKDELSDYGLAASLSMSPNGRYAIVEGFPRDIPDFWSEYREAMDPAYSLQTRVAQAARWPGRSSPFLRRFLLLDLEKQTATPLLNTPSRGPDRPRWSADGRSVLVFDAFLPLDKVGPAEKEARRSGKYHVAVQIPSLRYRKLGKAELSGRLLHSDATKPPVEIVVREDLNLPPRIEAIDRLSGERKLLLDPNPQLRALALGEARNMTWQTAEGREAKGVLYLPPDYTAGQRYPLVMQTHGFDSKRFEMDGSGLTSAHAARALAGRGFLVVQAGELSIVDGAVELRNFEGAIDALDRQGMIDLERMGIAGFSSTVYTAGYAVVNSKYRFAAATLVDGIDGGYVNYILFMSDDMAASNGGPPFGENLPRWLKSSPGFNLERFDAPLRLVAFGATSSILAGWQWFSGLSQLRKPVDFVYLPDAAHVVVKPWERRVAQQGMVDWFDFWLRRREDPDPAKARQYQRWRSLPRSPTAVGALASGPASRGASHDEIRKHQSLGRFLTAPDARTVFYEWQKPYDWAPAPGALHALTVARKQTLMYRVDVTTDQPASEYVLHPKPGATYYMGDLSADGKWLGFYEVDRDDNSIRCGAVLTNDDLSPRIVWFAGTPDGTKLHTPPVWLSAVEMAFQTKEGWVSGKILTEDEISTSPCKVCSRIKATTATEPSVSAKHPVDVPAGAKVLAQAANVTTAAVDTPQSLKLLLLRMGRPEHVIFDNDR